MRFDSRPYLAHTIARTFEAWRAQHFLFPQFDAVGDGCKMMNPRHIHVYGANITLGRHVHINATQSDPVRLTSWPGNHGRGRIKVGDYCLISPGTRISSSILVEIGDASMIASNVYITDSDWHDVYDRTEDPGRNAPVRLAENVWIGDGAILCKGAVIGRNSIVGAGSVVVASKPIPPNVVAAGNPARVMQRLSPDGPFRTRAALFANPEDSERQTDALHRTLLSGNSWLGWIRSMLFPSRLD